MTTSRLTGYLMSSAICAGGTPETNRVEVFRNYDLREKKERAKVLAKIKPDPYWGRY
jgi:aromatic ring hydroxylase